MKKPDREPPLAIEGYGVIGDMHSVALVGRNGSIDWFCYPHFDSPSVFARILDAERGGHFRIAPKGECSTRQYYLPDTNVLVTRFAQAEATAELIDFMPVRMDQEKHRQHRLVRIVRVLHGRMSFNAECRPAFHYGSRRALVLKNREGLVLKSIGLSLTLRANRKLAARSGVAEASFTLTASQEAVFILEETGHAEECVTCFVPVKEADEALTSTVRFWRSWAAKSDYRGRWREQVIRSALVLKLLTYQPSGAMVASPTTSLPEEFGGERNWDYRFTWFRDAAFVVYALLRIGFKDEAAAFMDWLERHAKRADGKGLRPMYPVEGTRDVPERTIRSLGGHRESAPVRVGNEAYDQFQLDIYGAIFDAVYLYNKHAVPISKDAWENLAPMLDWLCANWKRPDRSIWEIRGKPQRFTYSMVMSWVALDRGIRVAENRSFEGNLDKWRKTRDEIQKTVYEACWDDRKKAFIQAPENDSLDAALLLMPLVFFVGPQDRRFLSTLEKIQKELAIGPLVYRYQHQKVPEGVGGGEGVFLACSFWLVEALTRAGRVSQAHDLFQAVLAHANPLGLFAEQMGPRGEYRGNYPLALSHLALISAAYNLDRRLGRRG